ncbi:MAG TPA: cbb3-type cytochrome c oxidase subunit I [Candidatus Kryptonia bacterium]|nr:cbb3-type cytochrome c oxidase subunit I [Candidatus Kryptonia bacterium]
MAKASEADGFVLDATHRAVVLLLIIVPTVLLVIGIYFGVLQVLARAGLVQSGALGIGYYQGLTLHGVVNAIVFTTMFEVAFGYAVVAYFLRRNFHAGATWLAFALMLIGTLMAAFAMLSGSASVLYTFYPPLKASPLFYIGATLLVVGSWVPFFQWIAAYLAWRREHAGRKTPLAVVGMLATFTVWLLATLPLAYEVIVQLIPWSLGLTSTVNVVLARTLFWFFGHPLVYFWLLPAYVMFYVSLPQLAGGKLYSDPAARLAFMLFIVFSVPVGLHHQFADPGISAGYKWLHGVFTFCVALPSFMTAFTLAASLEIGARARGATGLLSWWRALPYFDRERYLFAYCIAGLWLFVLGGITGIINASVGMNNVVHNTAWIPGHFHTTIGGPVFLSFLGMSVFLVAQLTGKRVRLPSLNLIVPYAWTAGVLIFSLGLSVEGLLGAPRRSDLGQSYANPNSPLFQPGWQIWSQIAAIGGVIMGLAMLAYFVVFFTTLLSPKQREASLTFPTAEAYHDADTPFVRNFTPWVVAAIVLILIAYVPPLYEIVSANVPGARGYLPSSPVAPGP